MPRLTSGHHENYGVLAIICVEVGVLPMFFLPGNPLLFGRAARR